LPVLAATLRDGGYDLHDLRRTASATDRGASAPGQKRLFAEVWISRRSPAP
jgi:hypothetical protein